MRNTVNFAPHGPVTNEIIGQLNNMHGKISEQEIAYFMASNVAAIAFMMLETNKPEVIKALFAAIIDDAQEKRKIRAKLLAKEANNV